MLFDTDVLIFAQRGNTKAARLIEKTQERNISIYTYMELLQNASNKEQHRHILSFIKDFNFKILAYSKIIPLLIEAIKDQNEAFKVQNNTIEQLKEKIEALERR